MDNRSRQVGTTDAFFHPFRNTPILWTIIRYFGVINLVTELFSGSEIHSYTSVVHPHARTSPTGTEATAPPTHCHRTTRAPRRHLVAYLGRSHRRWCPPSPRAGHSTPAMAWPAPSRNCDPSASPVGRSSLSGHRPDADASLRRSGSPPGRRSFFYRRPRSRATTRRSPSRARANFVFSGNA